MYIEEYVFINIKTFFPRKLIERKKQFRKLMNLKLAIFLSNDFVSNKSNTSHVYICAKNYCQFSKLNKITEQLFK